MLKRQRYVGAHALGKECGKAALEELQRAVFPAEKARHAPEHASQSTLVCFAASGAVVLFNVLFSIMVVATGTERRTVDLFA